jgi:tRNA-dihydrouridine synthase B
MIKFPKLESKLVLAPMHNITNIAFRRLCKEYGASLVSTELLSANAIARKNKKTLELAKFDLKEKPIAAQIFSQNTENMVQSAIILEERGFDMIDINLGCPSKKILSQGSGGALLKRKNKIYEMVSNVVKNVKIPVTVKIRSGYDKSSINAIEISKLCEAAGASAIIIHARTVDQGYSGKADWDIIKQVKESVNIPVIGNGDVFTPEDAKELLEKTKCDYIMIGRGSIGNPFIFQQIKEYLESGQERIQKPEEKLKDFFRYVKFCEEYDIVEKSDIRLKAQEFTKNLNGSSKLRARLNKIKNIEEIYELLKEFSSKTINLNK